jgi:hypothetical protein
VRSVLCSALLVPLWFASGLASAQERPAGRVSRSRALQVPRETSGALPELHVAGGTATVLTVDAPLAPEGPRLQDEHGRFRLVPLEGASFIVLPSVDVPEGERPRLTVPLQSGEVLELALVSHADEVDTEVRLVFLPVPLPVTAQGIEDVARLLNASAEGAVELALPKNRFLVSGAARLQLKSILRIGQQVFITLSSWDLPLDARLEQQLHLRAVMRNGSVAVLSVVQVEALPSTEPRQRHTLMGLIPHETEQLSLQVKGGPALPLSMHRTKRQP